MRLVVGEPSEILQTLTNSGRLLFFRKSVVKAIVNFSFYRDIKYLAYILRFCVIRGVLRHEYG